MSLRKFNNYDLDGMPPVLARDAGDGAADSTGLKGL